MAGGPGGRHVKIEYLRLDFYVASTWTSGWKRGNRVSETRFQIGYFSKLTSHSLTHCFCHTDHHPLPLTLQRTSLSPSSPTPSSPIIHHFADHPSVTLFSYSITSPIIHRLHQCLSLFDLRLAFNFEPFNLIFWFLLPIFLKYSFSFLFCFV